MFKRQMTEYIRDALSEGLHGWEVTDCVVTLIDSGYRAPGTTAADFRKLTPLVLFAALKEAATTVCEPILNIRIEAPSTATSSVMGAVVALGGNSPIPAHVGPMTIINATLPAARLSALQHQLPSVSGGEGVLESTFAGYEPVPGDPPTRRRVSVNPLKRDVYLSSLVRGRKS